MNNPFEKTLSEHARSPLSLGAIAAFLILLTQFDKGLNFFVHKWNADIVADAAQEKASKVDNQFQQYLAAQDANAKAQQAAANAINGYIQQQQQMRNAPNHPLQAAPPSEPTYWTATDPNGNLYCYDEKESWWPNEKGECE